MKPKIRSFAMRAARDLAALSNCCRRQFGALLTTPDGTILSSGYNGTAPGGPHLCGGDHTCERQLLQIPSGQRLEIGCIHAEQNAIGRAARQGTKTGGAWLFVTGEPCRSCARLIVASGIARVFIIGGVYADDGGVHYLERAGVGVECVNEEDLKNDG